MLLVRGAPLPGEGLTAEGASKEVRVGGPAPSALGGAEATKMSGMTGDDGWTTVLKKRDKNSHNSEAKGTVRGASASGAGKVSVVGAAGGSGVAVAAAGSERVAVMGGEAPSRARAASGTSGSGDEGDRASVGGGKEAAARVAKGKEAGPQQQQQQQQRTRRQHGSTATGVVKRREEWQDHCLIEMADGLEDVFCHRHRCQGKALPPAGTKVRFKLHLSSKSLCWQSGFVTWEEGEDEAEGPAKRVRGVELAAPPLKARPRAEHKKENVASDANRALLASPSSKGGGRHREEGEAETTDEPSPAPSEPSEALEAVQPSWVLATQDSSSFVDDELAPSATEWEAERGWADSLMGKILANKQAEASSPQGVAPPPGLRAATPPAVSSARPGFFVDSASSARSTRAVVDDDEVSLRRELLAMMGGRPRDPDLEGPLDQQQQRAAVHPTRRPSTTSAGAASDRITLRVVAVDEPKLPWLATADLPPGRAAPIADLRRRVEAAVEAGNASAIQKLKRRRETRKRAKRGDHCHVDVVDRLDGAVRIDAFAVNAAGAGAALRSMLDANVDALRRECGAETVDESEILANLGWAQLVSQLETILAKCEPEAICCNHLSRAFEKEFGSALVETLFGDFESLAALLRAPQLRAVVRLTESPGRPDLAVSLAPGRATAAARLVDHRDDDRSFSSAAATTPRNDSPGFAPFPLALKPSLSPTAFGASPNSPAAGPSATAAAAAGPSASAAAQRPATRSSCVTSASFSSQPDSPGLFSSPSPRTHRASTLSEPGTFALAAAQRPPLLPSFLHQPPATTRDDRPSAFLGGRLFDPALLRLDPGHHQHHHHQQPHHQHPQHHHHRHQQQQQSHRAALPDRAAPDDKRPRSQSAPSSAEITRAVGLIGLDDTDPLF
mmetsp:Transcript_5855/g.17635  ORF Transcript_5855/g.17635 Transcript_5855/m.17635 type:complete len:900 (+) Transcript_5855:32-2731(+)